MPPSKGIKRHATSFPKRISTFKCYIFKQNYPHLNFAVVTLTHSTLILLRFTFLMHTLLNSEANKIRLAPLVQIIPVHRTNSKVYNQWDAELRLICSPLIPYLPSEWHIHYSMLVIYHMWMVMRNGLCKHDISWCWIWPAFRFGLSNCRISFPVVFRFK